MTHKKITMKYWDSLDESSRYRALRKVVSNFSDSTIKDYSKMKAKEMDFVWDLVARHVKQSGDSHYKTYIDRTYLM